MNNANFHRCRCWNVCRIRWCGWVKAWLRIPKKTVPSCPPIKILMRNLCFLKCFPGKEPVLLLSLFAFKSRCHSNKWRHGNVFLNNLSSFAWLHGYRMVDLVTFFFGFGYDWYYFSSNYFAWFFVILRDFNGFILFFLLRLPLVFSP